ncbi:MAG: hypothetical protein ACR2QM_10900, partial [Longimicrobiales bacterium]
SSVEPTAPSFEERAAPASEPVTADQPDEDPKTTRGGALGLGRLFGRLGPRRGDRSRRDGTAPVVSVDPAQTRTPSPPEETPSTSTPPVETVELAEVPEAPEVRAESESADRIDPKSLGLPSTTDSMVSYLANRYRGVGQITAESLVDQFGADLFTVLQNDPDRVRGVVGDNRAEQVLTAWREDYARREQSAERPAAGVGQHEG